MDYRVADGPWGELELAVRDDEQAKAEALRCGIDASLPLKPRKIAQLCDLGERMLETARRVDRARLDIDLTMRYQAEANLVPEASSRSV